MPNRQPPRVTFWGAAQTVTGSMHLVEAGGLRVLLDCGAFQGRRAEAYRINSQFPFTPKDIDAVVITHGHFDHIGNLPNLVRQGFDGPIYCTPATRDLMAVMLADSAKIQEEDAAFLNKKRRPGEPRVETLYTRNHVNRTLRLVESVPYHRQGNIANRIGFRFTDAGHLLGSASVGLVVPGPNGDRTITFTGDLGRKNLPILRDPEPLPAGDLVITECTYGGRTHPQVEELSELLATTIKRTFERGGKILVPAFALGRTQTIVWFLHRLVAAGLIDRVPVFVDSPLSMAATEVFRLHPECFDEETSRLLEDEPDLFGHHLVRYVRSVEESKKLNTREEPCIVIASSGMCESGRIVHHLKYNIADERNTVVIIGYQAADTLGRRIVERRPEVRIHDAYVPLKAEVVVLNGFSSHADQSDLEADLGPLRGSAKHVRLVHGEEQSALALQKRLVEMGFADVQYPARGDSVELA